MTPPAVRVPTAETDPDPPPPPPAITVVDYARPTWEQIRRKAWRSAWGNGLIAGYLTFALAVVLLLTFAMAVVAFHVRLWSALVGVLIVFALALSAAAAGLAALGAFRLTIEADAGKAGLCTRCGYDLRATATRCPECGRRAKR